MQMLNIEAVPQRDFKNKSTNRAQDPSGKVMTTNECVTATMEKKWLKMLKNLGRRSNYLKVSAVFIG